MNKNCTLSKIERAISNLLLTIAGASLVFVMFLGFYDVFARYFFNASVVVREELFRICLIIAFATSFPVITLRREHLDVDLLEGFFRGRLKQLQLLVIDVLVCLSCGVLAWWMFERATKMQKRGMLFEELHLPQHYLAQFFSASLLFVAVVMAVFALVHLIKLFSNPKAEKVEVQL